MPRIIAIWVVLVGVQGACGSLQGSPVEEPIVPVGAPASKKVGAAGGSLTSTDGHLQLTVPAGALSGEVNLEIQQLETATGWAWSLLPNGTQFAMPVAVTMTFSSGEVPPSIEQMMDGQTVVTPSGIGALHFSDGGAAPLEVIAEPEVASGSATFTTTISHFSVLTVYPTEYGTFTYPSSFLINEPATMVLSTVEIGKDYRAQALFLQCTGGGQRKVERRGRRVVTDARFVGSGGLTVNGDVEQLDIGSYPAWRQSLTCTTTTTTFPWPAVTVFSTIAFELQPGETPFPAGCDLPPYEFSFSARIKCHEDSPGEQWLYYRDMSFCESGDDSLANDRWFITPSRTVFTERSNQCPTTTPYRMMHGKWQGSATMATVTGCGLETSSTPSWTFTWNEPKQRFDGMEFDGVNTFPVCLRKKQPWNPVGTCVVEKCVVFNLDCQGTPIPKLLTCGNDCNSGCACENEARPRAIESGQTPTCY